MKVRYNDRYYYRAIFFSSVTSALLFDFIDKNGDGKISKAELIKYANLHNYNPTDEDLEMFKQERFNSDGRTLSLSLSFNTFDNVLAQKHYHRLFLHG